MAIGPESRRDFLKAMPERVMATVIGVSFAQEALADVGKAVVACLERSDTTNTALSSVCSEPIDDPEKEMKLIEGLRSTPAFIELANRLRPQLDISRGKITCLYPGAGSHIAPLYMAAEWFKDDAVQEAEFLYTEIDECKWLELLENLRLLSQVDPNFLFYEELSLTLPRGRGEERMLDVRYKGKKITLRFFMNCNDSEKQWFRTNEFQDADVYIQHDSAGSEISGILFMVLQYFRAQYSTGSVNGPPLIMEDTTRKDDWKFYGHPKYHRAFDLELLGTLMRGKKPYGHRTHVQTALSHFTETQACREQDEFVPDRDIMAWVAQGTAPERHMSLSTEVGDPDCKNGTILNIHPALRSLNPRLFMILLEIGLVSKHYSFTDGMISTSRHRLDQSFSPGGTDLFSAEFFTDLFFEGQKILESLRTVNPRLAEAFAIRVYQTILKLHSCIPEFIEQNFSDNPSEGYRQVQEFIDFVSGFLGRRSLVLTHPSKIVLEKQLRSTKRHHQKIIESHNFLDMLRGDLEQAEQFLDQYGDKLFENITRHD